MTQAAHVANPGGAVRKFLVGVVFTVVVVGMLLALAGVFSSKIGAAEAAPAAERPVGNTPLAEARLLRTPVVEPAVGTIRAVHETSLASKLLAKVIAVDVQAGQEVKEGDVLVRLDDEDLRARLQQSQAAVRAAEAARDQAQIEFDRTKKLYDAGNAAPIEFDRVQTGLRGAQAEFERAQQGQREADTVLAYATIRSPLTGKVIDKRVEVGDTASPGQVLLTLYDPTHMQLIASVRESLTERLSVGQNIGVRVDALHRTCAGRISEIVPEAESASRTFQVKVTGPCPPGIYSGMFGRLLIPLDDEEVLVIPRAAVRRIGQLDVVDVVEKAGEKAVLRRRAVRLGRDHTEGDQALVEVLSGLKPGERVALSGTD